MFSRRFWNRPPARSKILLLVAAVLVGLLVVIPLSDATAGPTSGKAPEATARNVLDAASALRTARLRNERVEVAGERTETSTTWANPSGSFTRELAAGPIWTKKNGQWAAVDVDLRVDADGVRPKAASWDAVFARPGGTRDNALISARNAGHDVTVKWPGQLPEPRVNGATATYPDIQPDTDLVVEARRTGFEQHFVLRRRPTGPVSFAVPISSAGLKARKTESGVVEFANADGKAIATMPEPRMWGAARDEHLGEPLRSTTVAYDLEQSGDTVTVILRPDPAFLLDPKVIYPLTVDPYLHINTSFDTYVDNKQTSAQFASVELQAGTNGTKVARSFVNFDVGALRGANIDFAKLLVWNNTSYVCAPRPIELWSTSGPVNTTTVWSNQPALVRRYDVKVESHHYNACGGSAWIEFLATDLVRDWLHGSNNLHSVAVKAGDEANIEHWKKFQSAEANSAIPFLAVDYSWPLQLTRPGVSPSTAPEASPTWTRSDKPTLSAWLADDDDVADQVTFEVQNDAGAPVTSGTVTAATPNATVSWQVPVSLTGGKAYQFRARASKNGAESATSWLTFTPDFVAPGAPAVASVAYPDGKWAGGPGTPGEFTITPPTSDVAWLAWQFDEGQLQETQNSGTPHKITLTPDTDGKHTLKVWTRDVAGNESQATTYRFNAGAGAVASPENGARTARRVVLSAHAREGLPNVTYAYRRGDADTWKQVPAGDARKRSDGSAITWPVGVSAELVWDVTRTLAADGPIQIRAEFTANLSSQAVELVVDRDADTAASKEIGPGTVNMLTGDYALPADDASAFGVGISRTFSSREPLAGGEQEGMVALFGPAWTAGGVSQNATSKFTLLRRTSDTSVEVVRTDGSAIGFTRNPDGTWTPQPDAGALSLIHDATTDRFNLRDTEGRTTIFAKASAAVTSYAMRTSFPATANNETTFVYDTVVGTDRKTRARLRKIISPTDSPGQCDVEDQATLPNGCRVLELIYAPRTTASAGALGDYIGQVSLIKVWESEASVKETGLTQYSYDTLGRLREVWDPRIAPGLKTKYEYDSGRIVKLTPPGELPWTFFYGRAGNDDTAADGMLLAVSRPALKPGTSNEVEGDAVTTLVYDVPVSGAGAPYGMGEQDVAAWGQTDVPSDATAIFPADQNPPAHTGRGNLGSGDYHRATVHYLNPNGHLVNEVQPGGHTSTTEYDRFGNTVRKLIPANRALALGQVSRAAERLTELGIANKSTSDRALLLSSTSVFDVDGLRHTHEYGPLHVAQLQDGLAASGGQPALPAGSRVPARKHKAQFYDEGRPTDGSAKVEHKVTRTVTGATVTGYTADADQRVITSEYDWHTGLETKSVQDPGGLALTKVFRYDAQGHMIESSLPASNGNDAGTTVTTYYSATGAAPCGGKPEWAGMICRTGPKAPITGGGTNPSEAVTKTLTYTSNGLVNQIIETANGQTRTTTTTYDAAGRKSKVTVTGLGEAVPEITTEYDAATGLPARTVASDASSTAVQYDALGRILTYTDADGGRTTHHYDALNRTSRISNSVPSSVSYTYDTTKEPRGLAVALTDSVAGTFTARYDAGGGIIEQAMPSGVIMRQEADETGNPVRRGYTAANGTVLLNDTASISVHDRVLKQSGLSTQNIRYDNAGRMVGVADTVDGVCTTRSYGYDKNSNRTSKRTAVGASGQPCPADGGEVRTHKYDARDRLVDDGYVYDAFGRTTAMPGGTSLSYYVNDRIRSQTVGSRVQTWTIDPLFRSRSVAADALTRVNHYGDADDSPDWIVENAGTGEITRNVKALDGMLAAVTSAGGDVKFQLTNLHGDVNVVYEAGSGTATVLGTDEFGVQRAGQQNTRYGWLGGAQRSAEALGGAMVMGARLYDPAIGRFLQVDAATGGNANSYEYCNGDPANCTDTTGHGPNCERRWYFFWQMTCGVIINLTPYPIKVLRNWGQFGNWYWLWPWHSTGWGRDYDGFMATRWVRLWWTWWVRPYRWFQIPNTPIWAPTLVTW